MLTPRQAEVLDAIYQHVATTGTPPTVRELCTALGISSPNGVTQHLDALRKKGAIEPDDEGSKARQIMPTGLRAELAKTAREASLRCKRVRKAVCGA